jgi:hypothetical protein
MKRHGADITPCCGKTWETCLDCILGTWYLYYNVGAFTYVVKLKSENVDEILKDFSLCY